MASIYTGTTPMSDALVAAVTTSIDLTLLDRSGGGILANPVVASQFQGRNALMRALGSKTVYVAYGKNKFAAVAEGTGFTVYTLDSDAATVTPSRRGFARTASDMARALDDWGITDWARFAADTTVSWQQSVVALLASLFPTFTEVGGNTGGAATWGSVVTDFQTLGIAGVEPPYTLILRPKDWANIAQDAMTIGGRLMMRPETDQVYRAVNPGFKGIYMNGDLWIYTSDECPASGGDHVGGMFGRQALAWNAFMAAPSPACIPILWTPVYGLEIERNALKTEDNLVSSTHLGASLGIDAAGIQCPFLT